MRATKSAVLSPVDCGTECACHRSDDLPPTNCSNDASCQSNPATGCNVKFSVVSPSECGCDHGYDGQGPSSSVASSASSDSQSELASPGFTPRDGGWGWVVVFASFMVNTIADGVTFSFGVVFLDFLHYFGASKSKTAWIGSLFMGVPLLAGPLASTLTDRFGCRVVTMAGGLLAAIGFILSSFCNSIELLLLTFGIMSGFGLALCYVAAIVIVAYYFEKRRAFATGVSVCGSGIGTFVFAHLNHYLVEKYTWRGALLIHAGFFLNIIVCGALMRDLEGTRNYHHNNRRARSEKSLKTSTESLSSEKKSQVISDESHRLLESTDHSHPTVLEDCERLCNSLVNLPTFLKQNETCPKELLEKLGKQGVNYEFMIQNYPYLVNSGTFENLDLRSLATTNTPPLTPPVAHSPKVTSPLDSDNCKSGNISGVHISETDTSLVPEAGLCNGVEMRPVVIIPDASTVENNSTTVSKTHSPQGLRTQEGGFVTKQRSFTRRLSAACFQNLRLYRRSLMHRNAVLNTHRYRIRASSCPDIYRNSMITITPEQNNKAIFNCMQDVKETFADMVDISYFKNIKFLTFAISNFLLYTWYDVPYVYIPDHALTVGINENWATHLVSLTGLFNTIGELAFGYSGDNPKINTMLLYSCAISLCGVSVLLIPFVDSFAHVAILNSIFGFTIAANYALTSIILVELISLENFTSAYGLLLLIQGVANLIGPPLAGWLRDITGNYSLSFIMSGVLIFLSGCMTAVLPITGYIQIAWKLCRVKHEMKNNEKEPQLVASKNCEPPKSIQKGQGRVNDTHLLNTHVGGKTQSTSLDCVMCSRRNKTAGLPSTSSLNSLSTCQTQPRGICARLSIQSRTESLV